MQTNVYISLQISKDLSAGQHLRISVFPQGLGSEEESIGINAWC